MLPPASQAPGRRRAVDRERLRVMWRQTPAAVLATFVVGGGTCAVVSSLTDGITAAWWYGALVLVTATRLGLYLEMRRRLETTDQPEHDIRRLGALAWATAVCWGVQAPLFMDPDEPLMFTMAILADFGIISGALGSLGASLPAYMGFVLLIVVPVVVKHIVIGGLFGWAITFMSLAYLVASLSFARVANRTLVEAIGLRFANEELVDRLTEEKDRAIAARQVAETATMAKTRFLAAASHDLRQPLHAQAFFLEALAEQAADDESRHLTSRIASTSRALRTLLDALLDISRLDAGTIEPSVRPFPIQPLFDQIRTEFEELATSSNLRLRAIPTTRWVRSDPEIVLRILRNLVANAVRYTHEGGVLVACRRGEPLRIQVFDTGVGIPEEARGLVFEEFTQLENPERDRSKGIGLGLAIVRRLVRLLGAQIELASTAHRGSTFTLVLPSAAGRAVKEEDPAEVDPAVLEGISVLVVDDEVEVREALRALLERWGCVVLDAGSPQEAARIAAGNRVDIVVADYRLRGGETGQDVLREVQQAAQRVLPAVLVTGDTAPERILEARAAGVPLLHKPVSPQRLRRTLARELAGPT